MYLSAGEGEYVAMSTCAKKLSWLPLLFGKVLKCSNYHHQAAFLPPLLIYSFNTIAITLSTNQQASWRAKHMDLNVHHVRELMENVIVYLRYATSKDQPADVSLKLQKPPLNSCSNGSKA